MLIRVIYTLRICFYLVAKALPIKKRVKMRHAKMLNFSFAFFHSFFFFVYVKPFSLTCCIWKCSRDALLERLKKKQTRNENIVFSNMVYNIEPKRLCVTAATTTTHTHSRTTEKKTAKNNKYKMHIAYWHIAVFYTYIFFCLWLEKLDFVLAFLLHSRCDWFVQRS